MISNFRKMLTMIDLYETTGKHFDITFAFEYSLVNLPPLNPSQ